MASSAIHLAVAKKYLEQHKDLDYKKVLDGTLYPDTTEDNDISHYTNKNRGSDNVSHVRGKVDLYAFLLEHETLDDYHIGWFLHLITDYLFFDECFTTEYLLSRDYKVFCEELYFAYKCLNLYLTDKYDIKISDYEAHPQEYYPGIPYQDCILSKEDMDKFIIRVSSIDLEKYIEKILTNKGNIKP